MKAIQVQTAKDGRPLVWQETNDPDCGPNEVLVDIHAAALNRADLSQRAGNYPPPPGSPDILGLEIAGRIRRLRRGRERMAGWRPGLRPARRRRLRGTGGCAGGHANANTRRLDL